MAKRPNAYIRIVVAAIRGCTAYEGQLPHDQANRVIMDLKARKVGHAYCRRKADVCILALGAFWGGMPISADEAIKDIDEIVAMEGVIRIRARGCVT
jgi:hypothetical protein